METVFVSPCECGSWTGPSSPLWANYTCGDAGSFKMGGPKTNLKHEKEEPWRFSRGEGHTEEQIEVRQEKNGWGAFQVEGLTKLRALT